MYRIMRNGNHTDCSFSQFSLNKKKCVKRDPKNTIEEMMNDENFSSDGRSCGRNHSKCKRISKSKDPSNYKRADDNSDDFTINSVFDSDENDDSDRQFDLNNVSENLVHSSKTLPPGYRMIPKNKHSCEQLCFECHDIFCEKCESKDRRILELELRLNELVEYLSNLQRFVFNNFSAICGVSNDRNHLKDMRESNDTRLFADHTCNQIPRNNQMHENKFLDQSMFSSYSQFKDKTAISSLASSPNPYYNSNRNPYGLPPKVLPKNPINSNFSKDSCVIGADLSTNSINVENKCIHRLLSELMNGIVTQDNKHYGMSNNCIHQDIQTHLLPSKAQDIASNQNPILDGIGHNESIRNPFAYIQSPLLYDPQMNISYIATTIFSSIDNT